MKNIRTTAAVAAIACLAALSAVPASAAVISNPTNTDSFVYLSGAGTGGGQQTQFVGETFTAPISGAVTNFQFTLNSSALPSLYGAIYAWDGSQPTTLLWQSPVVSASAGLLDFSPVGANVTQGQTYVAFLSTYGIDQNGHSNAGSATVADCLPFAGCNSNSIPNLGNLVFANVLADGPVWREAVNNSRDATFSVTITSAVPEPTTWAMLILGFAGVGLMAVRRRSVRRRPERFTHGCWKGRPGGGFSCFTVELPLPRCITAAGCSLHWVATGQAMVGPPRRERCAL